MQSSAILSDLVKVGHRAHSHITLLLELSLVWVGFRLHGGGKSDGSVVSACTEVRSTLMGNHAQVICRESWDGKGAAL